jgi:hypothetical protein
VQSAPDRGHTSFTIVGSRSVDIRGEDYLLYSVQCSVGGGGGGCADSMSLCRHSGGRLYSVHAYEMVGG